MNKLSFYTSLYILYISISISIMYYVSTIILYTSLFTIIIMIWDLGFSI